MVEFKESEWAEEEHARDFVDNSDVYIMERKRMFQILRSFFNYFSKNKKDSINILDLGCGDGVLTRELFKVNNNLKATLVDGSSVMIKNAREKITNSHVKYFQLTFQELLETDYLNEDYDFIISSLAIHHLSFPQKQALFEYIYGKLTLNGHFLNIDTIKAPNDQLESWYRILWSEWIKLNEAKYDLQQSFQDIPQKYQNNPDNLPDSLDDQLNQLRSVGFKNVDCFYKYGIFAMYGGSKLRG